MVHLVGFYYKLRQSYPMHTIKACGGRRVTAALIVYVRTVWGVDENVRCIDINCVMHSWDFA